MAEMMGMLLVLLCASHASASECAALFRYHLPILEYRAGGIIPEKQMVLLVQRGTLGEDDSERFALAAGLIGWSQQSGLWGVDVGNWLQPCGVRVNPPGRVQLGK